MRFTVETAHEMARRSVEARAKRKLNPPAVVQTSLQNGQRPEQFQDELRARAIKRLERQMDQIDAHIDRTDDPDAFHKLTTARGKLFEQWRILSGIPMPGSRKPAAEKAQKRGPMPDPI